MAASKDDASQQVEKDDVNPVSFEDELPKTSGQTCQKKSNGITNRRAEHAHRSHSGRDLGQDGKEKGHESRRRTQSSSSSLVGTGSKPYNTKYFIIKSLNHHNIEKSVENGIWATQAMNEPVLNGAFESADRVLLVFSVNMSGHFQGYAQMTSPIGRRRANVWSEANEGANPWGGSFSVDWLRLYDLPFQKTVHLKNPLNFFKPVKISRDCQELAEEIGQALCALIDEGADREGRPKRKVTAADLTALSLKRRRRESPGLPDGSQSRQQLNVRRNDASFSAAYGSRVPQGVNHEPLSPGPVSRASRGFSSDASSHPLEPRRGSKSKSPHPASSERSLDREQDNEREKKPRRPRKPLERNNSREWTHSSSSGRSADLPVEEDLLSMTYEDYLQRHGHSREFNNGYQQQGPGHFFQNSLSPGYGGGWSGRNAGMGFPEERYSDYVSNWYNRQGPPMGRDAFYDAGGIGNYPGNRPPDAH